MLIIEISGSDALNFLNRQATNDLKQLPQPIHTAFLKPNAEIISLAEIKMEDEKILIICNNPEELKEHLEKFVIVEDVSFELREQGDCFAALAMTDAALAMTDAALAMTDASLAMTDAALAMTDAALAMTDASLLAMTNKSFIKLVEAHPEKKLLEKYVSFTKGCFPGQEPLAKYKNIGLKKREERSSTHLDEALAIFAHAKNPQGLDPAIELLRKALKENPRNEDAMESLGVMLAKQEKYQEAIQVMHMLEMINPQNEMAQMNLSIFYMKIGDKETAEEHKAKGTVLQFDKALKK